MQLVSIYPVTTSTFAYSLLSALISEARACKYSSVCDGALQQHNTNNAIIQSFLCTCCGLFPTLTKTTNITTTTWPPQSELTPTCLWDYHHYMQHHHSELDFTPSHHGV